MLIPGLISGSSLFWVSTSRISSGCYSEASGRRRDAGRPAGRGRAGNGAEAPGRAETIASHGECRLARRDPPLVHEIQAAGGIWAGRPVNRDSDNDKNRFKCQPGLTVSVIASRNMSSTPCRFFQEGRCNQGRKCSFSHDPSVLKKPVVKAPCRYFLAGNCLAGDACAFAHVAKKKEVRPAVPVPGVLLCPKPTVGVVLPSKSAIKDGRPSGPMIASLGDGEDTTYETESFIIGAEQHCASGGMPSDSTSYAQLARKGVDERGLFESNVVQAMFAELMGESSTEPTAEEMAYRQLVHQRIKESEGKECGICLELVLTKGNQFGILSGCNHIFCLNCIREWRSVEDLDKSVKRSCPLCRCESHLVVPSSYIPADEEEKVQLVEFYKARLKKIPCKHFKEGSGECPFGTSCFYEHRFRDGSLSNPGPPRLRVTEDGEVMAVARLKLSDMVQIRRR
jgi:E3 ubiquitin-protein ligase makorin